MIYRNWSWLINANTLQRKAVWCLNRERHRSRASLYWAFICHPIYRRINVSITIRGSRPQSPLLSTWFNFNLSMEKEPPVWESVRWNYLSIPKLQRCNRWSLEMAMKFHPIFHNGFNYLSMLGTKLNHVSKMGPRKWYLWAHNRNFTKITLLYYESTDPIWSQVCALDVFLCKPWHV